MYDLQVLRLTFQSSQSPLPSDDYLTLLLCVAQVHPLQIRGVLFTSLLAEDKIDDGQELVLLEMVDEVCPYILVENMTGPSTRRTESSPSAPSDRTGRSSLRCTIDPSTTIAVVSSCAYAGMRGASTGR